MKNYDDNNDDGDYDVYDNNDKYNLDNYYEDHENRLKLKLIQLYYKQKQILYELYCTLKLFLIQLY